jgi:NAD-dependent SIR2 family protein deacetylase
LKVNCDECHKDFEIKHKTRKIDKFIVGSFRCPHCKQEYIGYVMDKDVKKMQERRKSLMLQTQKAYKQRPLDMDKVQALEEEYQQLDGKYIETIAGQHIKLPGTIANRMDELKKEYLEKYGAK